MLRGKDECWPRPLWDLPLGAALCPLPPLRPRPRPRPLLGTADRLSSESLAVVCSIISKLVSSALKAEAELSDCDLRARALLMACAAGTAHQCTSVDAASYPPLVQSHGHSPTHSHCMPDKCKRAGLPVKFNDLYLNYNLVQRSPRNSVLWSALSEPAVLKTTPSPTQCL